MNHSNPFRRRVFWQAICLVATFHAALALADDQERILSFGVLNQQSPARTAQRWNPILKYLSDATGLRFQLKMGPTVRETDAMMGRGEFDLVFTNHNFAKEYDGLYKVIARWSGKPIYGAIAVPADSPVKTIKDLAGKRVAFPSREAFAAYAVPMVALRAAKVKVEEVLAGNQEGALAQLRARQVDAVAVNSRYLTQYAAQNTMPYREVFSSEGYAELPVIAHPRLPRAEVEAIQRALLAMKTDPKAAAALEASGAPGFDPATERDYDNARAIYRRMVE
jgi:phosphonate transport system substrate-binding protein